MKCGRFMFDNIVQVDQYPPSNNGSLFCPSYSISNTQKWRKISKICGRNLGPYLCWSNFRTAQHLNMLHFIQNPPIITISGFIDLSRIVILHIIVKFVYRRMMFLLIRGLTSSCGLCHFWEVNRRRSAACSPNLCFENGLCIGTKALTQQKRGLLNPAS